MDFTPDEKRTIRYFAQRDSYGRRFGFYASILLPLLAFAGYGYACDDVNIVGLAFLGLLSFLVWNCSGESNSARLYQSIFSKLEDWLDQHRGG